MTITASAKSATIATIARAPGKLVLSGAYAVLEGAPAIVTAVDRYAVADASRCAERATAEVVAAIRAGALSRAPWFDASALRATTAGGDRKLGLGSSAAILVASLGAAFAPSCTDEEALRARVLPIALAAHRAAQGGGSGIDVAASVHGGTLLATLRPGAAEEPLAGAGTLAIAPWALPEHTTIEVLASPAEASTSSMLATIRAWARREPAAFRACLARIAEAAARAASTSSADAFVRALRDQHAALADLGRAAGAPIVPDAMARLASLALDEDAAFGPAGAGGGDVAVFVGARGPATERLRAEARALGLEPLPVGLAARGLHVA